MTQATMYARLVKIDEAKRQVTGVIASETPDRAKEILDYDTSKPYFESWSGTMAKASGGKSVGNVRAMHGNVAVGGLSELLFDDLAKTITVTADVVDDNEWNKCLKGTYTGFSVGGKYGKKWDDPMLKGHKRYTAVPSEVSLVDLPCNYDASFTLVKMDGSEDLVKFHVMDEAELLAKLADADVSAEDKADYAQRLAKLYAPDPVNQEDEELTKGAYSIGELARLADSVSCFARYSCCSWDENGQPVTKAFAPEVRDAALKLYDALLKLVADDVEAAKTLLKTQLKKMADEEELTKASAAEELRKQADVAIAEHDTLSKVFGISAFGIAEGAKLEDALESLNKFVTAHDELQKKHDEQVTEIADLKKRAEPAKGATRPVPVAKTDDSAEALKKDAATTEEDSKDPLTLMKSAQAKPVVLGMGGITLQKPA